MSLNGNNKPEPEPVNAELAKMLLELGEYEKNVNKQHFKFIAYKKAAHSVNECEKKITSAKDAKKLKGVGKRIAEKIDEYLKKGKIQRLEKARHSKDAKILKELNRVFGIGPSHAWTLLKEGVKSIDELRKHADKLTEHQQIGLKYVDDFEAKIPREDVHMMRDLILKEIDSIDNKYHATICGSYRRGAESSNDIDVLVTHPHYVSKEYAAEHTNNETINSEEVHPSHAKENSRGLLDRIISRLYEIKFLTDTLAHGDSKYMGVCLNPRSGIHHRIDIRVFPYDEYYCALLYSTGNDSFNIEMRKIAIEKGFTLNEYCLKRLDNEGNPVGKPIPIKSEKDIFDHIGMEYVPPEERSY